MNIFLLIIIYSSLLISADFNIDGFFVNYFEINPINTELTYIPPPINNITNTNQDNKISLKRKREENEFPKISTSRSPIFDALIILAHYEDSGVSFIGPKKNGYLQIDNEHKLFINTNNMISKKSPTKDIKSRKKTYAQKFTISHDKNKNILILIIKDNYINWYQKKLESIEINHIL